MTIVLRGASGLLALVLVTARTHAAPAAAPAFSHALLDTVLTRFVRNGVVDYGALSRDHDALDRYRLALSTAQPDGWPRPDQIAFWVNAYNAWVLDGVLRRPGLKNVMDVGLTVNPGAVGFFHESHMIAGSTRSLDDIEGTILPAFHEPRFHFVLSYASTSGPVLPTRALRGATLEPDLAAATRRFLTDPGRNRIEPRKGLWLSEVFDWHGGDFRSPGVPLQAWIERHWPKRERFAPGLTVRFLPYDWSLNGHW